MDLMFSTRFISRISILNMDAFICGFMRRRARHRVRAMMRGYRLLIKTNQFGRIRRLNAELMDTRFTRIDKTALPLIFGAAISQAEIVVQQFLFQKLAISGKRLNKALLYSLGTKGTPVVFHLPRVWQKVLIDHGFKVATLRSSLAWLCFVALNFCSGLFTIVRIAAKSFLASVRLQKPHVPTRYAYFENLKPARLPQACADDRSYDLVTWYSQWEGRASAIDSLCHDVHYAKPTEVAGIRVEYIDRPFPLLINFIDLLCFIGWALWATIHSGIGAFAGRWWHVLLLGQAANATVVQITESNKLARDYLFAYTGIIYRPLWTYEAEEKGSRIILYFLSTSEGAKLPQGGNVLAEKAQWGLLLNWPIILVWDEYQKELLRKYTQNKSNIRVVEPIYSIDSAVGLPKIPKRSIAVFDVQEQRLNFGFSSLSDYRAQNPGLDIQFIKDIHLALSECGVAFILKRKREIGNKSVKKYVGLIQNLSQSGAIISVDPGVSAIRVIEKCAGVISRCFTSTACYMQSHDIPNVYYDPTGWIQKDDPGAHGVPILSGIDELRVWLMHIFKL